MMGTWQELDIDITVNSNTDDLQQVINQCNTSVGDAKISAMFSEIAEVLTLFKNDFDRGVDEGAFELADTSRSLQELTIALNGSIAHQKLIDSIKIEEQGKNHYLVGTTIEHFYPLTIEKGRGEVRPINYQFLHYFTLSGKEIFSKYSRPTTPKPYVEPTFNEVVSRAESIMRRNIDNATK